MKPAALITLGLLAIAGPVLGQEGFSPHRMVDEKGNVDMGMCSLCHTESMELARPKAEVCTLCHAATLHSGVAEHLGARPERVARLMPPGGEGLVRLPLTEDGHIYCGTCHLFHDPAVSQEKPLASAWLPRSTGLPEAVRESVVEQLETATRKYDISEAPGAKFSSKGTKAMRLPVGDGRLCINCHGSLTR